MVFRYDPSKLNEYQKGGTKSVFYLMIFGTFVALPIIYFQMRDFDYILIIILATFVMMVTIGFIVNLTGKKKVTEEFNSYQIECDDYSIVIASKMFKKNINIEDIDKILKDNKNNIYIITNKINKTIIPLSYIENNEKLLERLASISTIEEYNTKLSFLQFLPMIFFFALVPISQFGNMELYLLCAVIVILTTVYSTIQLFNDQMRFKHKILPLLFNGFILFSVGRNIYMIISS